MYNVQIHVHDNWQYTATWVKSSFGTNTHSPSCAWILCDANIQTMYACLAAHNCNYRYILHSIKYKQQYWWSTLYMYIHNYTTIKTYRMVDMYTRTQNLLFNNTAGLTLHVYIMWNSVQMAVSLMVCWSLPRKCVASRHVMLAWARLWSWGIPVMWTYIYGYVYAYVRVCAGACACVVCMCSMMSMCGRDCTCTCDTVNLWLHTDEHTWHCTIGYEQTAIRTVFKLTNLVSGRNQELAGEVLYAVLQEEDLIRQWLQWEK